CLLPLRSSRQTEQSLIQSDTKSYNWCHTWGHVRGRLLLLDAKANQFKVISKLNLFSKPNDDNIFSHCALVGSRLYLRGESELICVDLSGE
ncbi:MAG: hypothetical protein K0U89_14270, partial [Planctomycetes bacterium]|nr:hypothetical protein [Planctomycetota bacterium]